MKVGQRDLSWIPSPVAYERSKLPQLLAFRTYVSFLPAFPDRVWVAASFIGRTFVLQRVGRHIFVLVFELHHL